MGRAQAWTQALTGWCEQQPEMVAHVGQCLIHRSEILHLRGQWSAALTEARRVITRIAQSKNSPVTGHALYREGEVYRLQGRFDRAESAYREAARFGYEPQPGLALLRLAQGKTTTAVSTIRRALAESNDSVRRARLLPACLEICLANRDLEQAQQACDELEDSAKAGPQKWVAQRAAGRVARRAGTGAGQAARGPRKTAARARRVAATRSAVRSCASACADRTGLPDVGRQRGRGAGVERSSQCVLPPARTSGRRSRGQARPPGCVRDRAWANPARTRSTQPCRCRPIEQDYCPRAGAEPSHRGSPPQQHFRQAWRVFPLSCNRLRLSQSSCLKRNG